MHKLTIELHLDNDAYQDQDGNIDYQAVQDQLILVAENVGDGNTGHSIKDINGNNSGQYFIETY
tara:strand:- start:294 stop:485 length:192 start_codon:yes stop_codon:yes gene_type:complete